MKWQVTEEENTEADIQLKYPDSTASRDMKMK